MIRLLFVLACLTGGWAASMAVYTPHAHGCAFSTAPTTYDPPANRGAQMLGMNLAGYNMITPDDAFFGTSRVETGLRGQRTVAANPYIPPTLLKAIGWIESGIAQADYNTPFGGVGPALISFDCGHGIMQITSGMTSPADGGWPSTQQALVATHYLYNVARGAAILVDKWNAAPEVRPVAGTDTGSDPRIAENWYFATWGYNGFTGPGANRSNHPSDPDYAWPRTGYSCGLATDGYGHSYANYPYQELVFGCAARPPLVDDERIWTAFRLSLPDLDEPEWADPLSLSNWSSCSSNLNCGAMDIPSPDPQHVDPVSRPSDDTRNLLLGAPVLAMSHGLVRDASTVVTVYNVGEGILPWRAKPGQSWISVNKQGGVALSDNVTCSSGAPCVRSPTLRITVDMSRLPPGQPSGWVNVVSLATGQLWQIGVEPNTASTPGAPTPTRTPTRTPTPLPPASTAGDVNCSTSLDSVDAALILQFSAGLIGSLGCPANGDVNGDGNVNALDAVFVLQLIGGLISAFPA
ncbi:MAG: dockerin type I domain-containing protein [Dehalococcoidia bacterium]